MKKNPLKPKGGVEYWKIPSFLPNTKLKKGAKGRTVKILQLALYDYYQAGIISTSPISNLKNTQKLQSSEDYLCVYNPILWDKFGVFGVHTERVVKEYLQKIGTRNEIVVDSHLWRALGLTVGDKLEDLFNIPTAKQKGKLRLKVARNEVIITYRPRFYVSDLAKGHTYLTRPASKEVRDRYIGLAIEGLFRWSKEEVSIGGIKSAVTLQLVDKNGNIIVKGDEYNSDNFVAQNIISANIFLYKGKPHQSKAFLSPYWRRNLNIVFSAGDTFSNKKSPMQENLQKGEDAFRTTVQHEFGHALGIADAYSYENHMKIIPLIGKSIGRLISPDSTDITGRQGIMAYGSGISELDYQMILFAWLRNRWQSYKGGLLGRITGETSQSFYYF